MVVNDQKEKRTPIGSFRQFYFSLETTQQHISKNKIRKNKIPKNFIPKYMQEKTGKFLYMLFTTHSFL